MDFTRPGSLNPDFAPDFATTILIRTVQGGVSRPILGLIRIRRNPLPSKARRVGRSTQTYLDAGDEPLRAEHARARERRPRCAVAGLARPHRSADHRTTRPAHRRCDPRRRDLCRPLRLRRQDRQLPWPLDLRSGAAVGGLGGRAARLWLAAPFARRRHRADASQCARTRRGLDRQPRQQAPPGRATRRRAGTPRDLAIVAGATGAGRHRQQILSPLLARARTRDPLAALHHGRHPRRGAKAPSDDRAVLHDAVPRQPGASHPQRLENSPTSCNGRSCPTADTSRATRAR